MSSFSNSILEHVSVFYLFFTGSLKRDIADRSMVLHEVIPGELEQVIDAGKADFGITYMPIANQKP